MTLIQGLMRVYSTGVNVNPVQVDICYENVTERSHRPNQSQIAEGRDEPEDPG